MDTTDEDLKIVRDLMIEEYKALRAESLRCAQTVATTVWVGITGFLITTGASVAATRTIHNYGALMAVTLTLLVLQAFGASVMFLSEYWRFVRIGIYIRTKIEEQFETRLGQQVAIAERRDGIWRPINWEHWIQGKRRAGWFPLASLAVLQLPAITVFILGMAAGVAKIPSVSRLADNLLLVEAGNLLMRDLSLAALLGTAWCINLLIVGVIAVVIYQEISKENGERLTFSARLLSVEHR